MLNLQCSPVSCPLKITACQISMSSMIRTLLLPDIRYTINHAKYTYAGESFVKTISICTGNSIYRSYSLRVMYKPFETPRALKSDKKQLKSDILEKQNLEKNLQIENSGSELQDDKELQRRCRVGHANKGRVPWNKGRKHSEETRERIRQRTREALKDPKVRKKMSECPRTMTNQTKARIRASLTKVWGKRLLWKRSRQKFLRSWAKSIAKAAKVGAKDQQGLDWDSYDKIKVELALQQQREAEEKIKAKEIARLQAAKISQAKAEKKAKLAEKRKERELNAKLRGELTPKRGRKSKEEIKKLAESQEVKLKERLMKIHRRKSAINRVSNQHQRSWEKFDVDFVKGETIQKDISLADQIRLAKNRREEQNIYCDKS